MYVFGFCIDVKWKQSLSSVSDSWGCCDCDWILFQRYFSLRDLNRPSRPQLNETCVIPTIPFSWSTAGGATGWRQIVESTRETLKNNNYHLLVSCKQSARSPWWPSHFVHRVLERYSKWVSAATSWGTPALSAKPPSGPGARAKRLAEGATWLCQAMSLAVSARGTNACCSLCGPTSRASLWRYAHAHEIQYKESLELPRKYHHSADDHNLRFFVAWFVLLSSSTPKNEWIIQLHCQSIDGASFDCDIFAFPPRRNVSTRRNRHAIDSVALFLNCKNHSGFLEFVHFGSSKYFYQ